MKINNPRWYHLKHNTIFTQINNVLGRTYKGEVGTYFKKADRYGTMIKYDEIRASLPQPILEDNPEWVELFNHIWESVFERHMQPGNENVGFPAAYINVGLDNKLYQWDMFFILQYAKYIDHIFPSIQALDNFYLKQRADGMIARIFSEKTGKEHWWGSFPNSINPPLFSWIELEYMKFTGDKGRLEKIIPPLEAYSSWLQNNMYREVSKHKLFWNTGDASGMDNTPREGDGWIDMSSQVVLNHLSLAKLYEFAGDEKNKDRHETMAEEISKEIDKWMWDEEDGFYYDVNTKGNKVKVKTIASFWPLLNNIISHENAERLVEHLKNKNEFWTDQIFPSLAKDEKEYNPSGQYWKGGVWAPTNYMVIKGLSNYGFDDLAREASYKYIQGIYEVYKDTGTIWEAYAPEKDDSGKLKPCTRKDGKTFCKDDFTGWSGVGPTAILIEHILGITVDAFKNEITWKITREDRHGINRLYASGGEIDLLVSRNSSLRVVDINTSKPFKLKIVYKNKEIMRDLETGANKIELV